MLVKSTVENILFVSLIFVYLVFSFNSYLMYFLGEFYLWQVFAVINVLIICFLYASCRLHFNYLGLLLVLYIIISFFVTFFYSSFDRSTDVIRSFQFLSSALILFSSVVIIDRSNKHALSFIRFTDKLLVLLISAALYQIVMRQVLPGFSFSDFQSFRSFGWITQATSIYREPRGLVQVATVIFFCALNFKLPINRGFWLISSFFLILFSFSLGGYFTLLVVIFVYSLAGNNKVIKILFFLLVLVSLTSIPEVNARIMELFSLVSNGALMNMVDHAYKLNHVDYYSQYSQEFSDIYGFSGNSSVVSIFSEISYFLHVTKINFLTGFGLGTSERYTSLNLFVDIYSRIGLLGLCFLIVYFFRMFKTHRMQIILFLIFWGAIDGALSKPQVWFPLALIYASYSYSEKKECHSSRGGLRGL
jgi:hypothetical protein